MLEMHPLLTTHSLWSKLMKPFTDKDKSFRLHFKYSAVLTLHGMVLNKAEQWSEAKEVLKKALAIRKKLLGPCNIYTAHSRVALGMAEYQIGSRLKQLSVVKRRFMPTHPRYAYHLGTYVYLTSAQVYAEEKNWLRAEEFVRKAIECIDYSCESNIHPTAAECYTLMASIKDKQHYAAEMQPYLTKAVNIYDSLIKQEKQYCESCGIDPSTVEHLKTWIKAKGECKPH